MAITIEHVVKTFGDDRVLDDLSFTAPTGQVTGLLGPNGAGKTTTMRILSTLLRADEGTVLVDGIDAGDDPDEVRRRIGLVTEEPGLFNRLTPREHLQFVTEVHGLATEAADAIDRVVESIKLTEVVDQRCGELSKGNRQKVALARALVHSPRVLLLDEPTANLDVVAAAGLESILLDPEVLADTTVLLSSHTIEEVERVATNVVGLVDGRVIAAGTKTEITAQLGATSFRDAIVQLLGGAVLGA